MKRLVQGFVLGMVVSAGLAFAARDWNTWSAFAWKGDSGLTKREYAAIHILSGLSAKYSTNTSPD